MAITFTNKAAGEMRERVDKLVGDAAGKVLGFYLSFSLRSDFATGHWMASDLTPILRSMTPKIRKRLMKRCLQTASGGYQAL